MINADGQLENRIWDELATCYDPEIPVNIVDLGLVYDCELSAAEGGGYHVKIKMTLPSPIFQIGPALLQEIEDKVKKIPQIRTVNVALAFEPSRVKANRSEVEKVDLDLA